MRSKRQVSAAVIVVAVVVLLLAAAVYFGSSLFASRTLLTIGDGVFHARLALDGPAREKGLSGVDSLQADEAMIFAFAGDDDWEIWMKDMKIPIDIVWLDKDKKVIYIAKNVSPDGGEDTRFRPKSAARYVIELPAGTVDSKAIVVGRTAVFEIDESAVKP